MAQLHSIGASIVLGALAVTGLGATLIATRGGSRWTDRLRIGLTVVIGLQVVSGVVLFAAGARPRESLHLLYGLAALAMLPLAATFASEAPPRPRAWVLAGACLILVVVGWRLASTG
jgi:4-amino-4-deoxy-L-arabinose transferase-like glycosyltransferase